MRKFYAITLLSIASLMLAACSSGASSKSGPTQQATQPTGALSPGPQVRPVTIEGFKFQPATLTVNEGDTVEFTNRDIVVHNAVSKDKFDSGRLGRGQSWKYLARQKGTFDYICTLHPNMKGQIVVK